MASRQPSKSEAKQEPKRVHPKRILFPDGTIKSSALVREILAVKPVENCIHELTATLRICVTLAHSKKTKTRDVKVTYAEIGGVEQRLGGPAVPYKMLDGPNRNEIVIKAVSIDLGTRTD